MYKKLLSVFAILLFSSSIFAQKVTLNHIAKYVVNLKVSTHFYMDIIGLDTIPEPFHDGKHTWFTVGVKGHLHLIQGAKKIKKQDKNNHICFSVASVSTFIKTLETHKIEFENWIGEKTPLPKE
jgi:lactoylglutathione lyase